jgi:hypothetical protein
VSIIENILVGEYGCAMTVSEHMASNQKRLQNLASVDPLCPPAMVSSQKH